MRYWGKIIGVAVALLTGDGFWGVASGLLIGHMFDKARSHKMAWFANQRKHQALFSATTFEATGHLTKPRGHITKADTHIASQLMNRMNLHGISRTAVQNTFRMGKSDSYPLREKIRQLHSVCFGRLDLTRMFLGIQIQTTFADGSLHPDEWAVLYIIAGELGVFRAQFNQFLRIIQDGAQFGGDYQQQTGGDNWQQAQRDPALEDICSVLSMKPTDGATVIKRTYRKLMSEYHPNKLVAKGLPPEMMEMAKQKAQGIQQTCELVEQQKGFE